LVQKKKLKGMICIEITPFNDKGELDKTSYIRELDHIVKSGITGIIAGGNISEGSQMPYQELMKLWKITIDHINGKIPVGVGTLAQSQVGVTALVKQAQDMGADFTMTPPGLGPMSPDQIYKSYSYIASRTDIPLMLYDSARYVPLPPLTALKLAEEFSNICYFKAEINAQTVFHLAEVGVTKKMGVMCGQERYLIHHLMDGAIGGTNSATIVAPELTSAVFKAAEEKNWTKAWNAFRELWPVMLALYNPGYGGAAFKEALYMMGIFDSINFCNLREPLNDAQKTSLKKSLMDANIKLVR